MISVPVSYVSHGMTPSSRLIDVCVSVYETSGVPSAHEQPFTEIGLPSVIADVF